MTGVATGSPDGGTPAAVGAPGPPSTTRRRDVQGLRAIAVLMVVAFHAGLPLHGGYLGVDVFFVISGFVITAMLERDRTGERTIDFGRFYRRRFLRLTPALVVMVVVTVVVSLFLLMPFGAQQEAAKTGLGAIGLVANFVIAKTTGGYFDAPAARNPLLHTWSLSVEEQIYLVFPALVAFAWLVVRRRRWPRVLVPAAVALAGAGSFAVMLARELRGITRGEPWLSGFYSPVTRLWEFVAGALLAYLVAWRPGSGRPPGPRARAVATTLAVAGLVGLVASAVGFDETTRSPGTPTLVPVLATVALLAAGSWVENPASRLLGAAPCTWVGDRSYSIYLWHWPVIVFAAIVWPGSGVALVVAALVSFAPALVSYRSVERPWRSRSDLRGRRFARFAAIVVVPGLVVTLGALVLSDQVIAPWFRSDDGPVAHRGRIGWTDTTPESLRNPCAGTGLPVVTTPIDGFRPECDQSHPAGPVDVAIIGDSHSWVAYQGLAEALPDRNVLVYAANGAPTDADRQFRDAFEWAAGPGGPDVVIIEMYWRRSFDRRDYRETVRRLTAAGRRVYLSDDLPGFPFQPEDCKYGFVLAPRCTMPRAEFRSDHRSHSRWLDHVATATGAEVLRTSRFFCRGRTCSMLVGDDLVFRDDNHLNVRGSRYLARRTVAAYPTLAGPPRSG